MWSLCACTVDLLHVKLLQYFVFNCSFFNYQAFLPTTETIPAIDKKGNSRSYITNDIVCCEVIDIISDSEKMVIGMKGNNRYPDLKYDDKTKFGLTSSENLPELYK